jgi:protoporphyrinogen oxidase
MNPERAIIIGAGPAGLTAAYELLKRTAIQPIVLEKSSHIGGLCRTVNYKGNRIDMGGHRFFSKSERVMKWWLDVLPLQAIDTPDAAIQYQGRRRTVTTATPGPDTATEDRVMLLRPRKSRCYFRRQFFDYPISLSGETLLKLGLWPACRIGASYLRSVLLPRKPETTLEQFFINRFGVELYQTFFKSYTEKVWGVPCSQISAEWGAQRMKGLSIRSALTHALRKMLRGADGGMAQSKTETSLIERFLYPKFGPGQMWEEVACRIQRMGGRILRGYEAGQLHTDGWQVKSLEATNDATGLTETFEGDYFFSTAPVQELLRSFDEPPPPNVMEVSEGLVYRDFIAVGLLVRRLRIGDIHDNWIYIQEPDVKLGRLQIFNNWSPYLVADASQTWLGLEYFCNTSDEIWQLSDREMAALAQEELVRIGIIDQADVEDATVLRMEKTYPAYFGTYSRFGEIREHVDRYVNLWLIGRNGMHRYNNQDHSMLTAMMAVDNILAGDMAKNKLWEVNTDMDYHESSAKS